MSAFDFRISPRFSDVSRAGSCGEVVYEAVIVAAGGGAEWEDGFGSVRGLRHFLGPEHLGPFDAVVHSESFNSVTSDSLQAVVTGQPWVRYSAYFMRDWLLVRSLSVVFTMTRASVAGGSFGGSPRRSCQL